MKSNEKQQHLFDAEPSMKFKGAGHRRTHMGAVIEEVVCGLLGFTRNAPGGSTKFQPDAVDPLDRPVEIKSVCVNHKLKGKSVLYDFRLEKERVHAPELAYVFACHPSGGKGSAKSLEVFLDRLTGPLCLAVVPAWIVRTDALSLCSLRTVKTQTKGGKRAGYKRAGYIDGYRNLEIHRYIRDAEVIETREFKRWGRLFSAAVFFFKPDPWSIDPRESTNIWDSEAARKLTGE